MQKHAFGAGIAMVSLFVVCAAPLPCGGQAVPPEIEALAREIDGTTIVADDLEVTPPVGRPDPAAPANALRTSQDGVRDLILSTNGRAQRSLQAALAALESAWDSFAAGSDDLSHLGRTTDALQVAQSALGDAKRSAPRDLGPRIAASQAALADIAARLAGDMLHRAQLAGVPAALLAPAARQFSLGQSAAKRGKAAQSTSHLGQSLKLNSNSVKFDVALFEQNINDALAGQTMGHAFSIAYLGQLYQGGESFGAARTATDAPMTAQSPSKRMHVASVSKTLTTIVTLHVLESLGLTPDAPIANYLPFAWARGNGVDQLTFRDFMTHRSGFGQKGAGNDFAGLQTAIAQDVNGPALCGSKNVGATGFCYSNANFGLMRVLVSRLTGVDPYALVPIINPGALAAAVFLYEADALYDSIGVHPDCTNADASPTIQYKFPDDGTNGYLEPDRRLQCGGYGWFISSNELAAVLANLRHTENLLSTEMRKTMQEGYLGFMDPANYSFIGGTFGVYSMHGGDWFHGSGELHSCVVAFPIKVEVALVINSARGAMAYQCDLLQTAFDNAWVSN